MLSELFGFRPGIDKDEALRIVKEAVAKCGLLWQAVKYAIAFLVFMCGGILICGLALPLLRQDVAGTVPDGRVMFWLKFAGGALLALVGAISMIISVGIAGAVVLSLFPNHAREE